MKENDRLGFFVVNVGDFEDIHEYIKFYLRGIRELIGELYIVCTQEIAHREKEFLKSIDAKIFLISDQFNDDTIFKTVFKNISEIMCDNTKEVFYMSSKIIGPVNNLETAINEMEELKNDFWSPIADLSDSREIIASPDFLVISRTLAQSYEFKNFLDSEITLKSFTYYFADKGFIWDSWVHIDEFCVMTDDPWVYYASELLEKKQAPIFPRRIFDLEYSELLDNSLGVAARNLLLYLEESSNYNVDYIWDYLLKTRHQSDIVKLFHMNYILSTTAYNKSLIDEIRQKRKMALVIHIYRTDMSTELARYASHMPVETDIYITTDTKEKKDVIEKIFNAKLSNKIIEVRIIENRGRDVSSKLVGVKDVIMQYDYVCCIHDKKTPHLKPMTIGEGFGQKCFDNIIYNKAYVNNILELFERNPRLGIAVPPEPNHATLFTTLGYEWSGNYEIAADIANKMGLRVPMDEGKEPVAPFGSFFWFRPKALKILYDQNWNYVDFPEEPIADDNTILHGIERIYPYVAQHMGYYPVIIQSDLMASVEYTNIKYYLREYNKVLIQNGIINRHKIMCETMKATIEETKKENQGLEKRSDEGFRIKVLDWIKSRMC